MPKVCRRRARRLCAFPVPGQNDHVQRMPREPVPFFSVPNGFRVDDALLALLDWLRGTVASAVVELHAKQSIVGCA